MKFEIETFYIVIILQLIYEILALFEILFKFNYTNKWSNDRIFYFKQNTYIPFRY